MPTIPDRFAELHDPWAEAPPLTDPLLLYVHANRKAFRALFEGDPAQARHHQQQAPRGDFGSAFRYVARWGEFAIALSYLWEGQVRLTESLLRPALAGAEGELGRRNPFVCMLAALLAAAVWELDRPQEAAALLANRLDVLERTGLPEAVLLGYRTAARIAAAEGAEHRALELLEGMHAVGLSRQPAAARGCEPCRSGADACAPLPARDLPRAVRAHRRDHVERRRSRAAGSGGAARNGCSNSRTRTRPSRRRTGVAPSIRWRGSVVLAESMHLGRVRIEVMALRAFALDRSGEKALPLLKEAMDLAQTYGLARLFVDAHPALGDWAQRVAAEQSGERDAPRAASRCVHWRLPCSRRGRPPVRARRRAWR